MGGEGDIWGKGRWGGGRRDAEQGLCSQSAHLCVMGFGTIELCSQGLCKAVHTIGGLWPLQESCLRGVRWLAPVWYLGLNIGTELVGEGTSSKTL